MFLILVNKISVVLAISIQKEKSPCFHLTVTTMSHIWNILVLLPQSSMPSFITFLTVFCLSPPAPPLTFGLFIRTVSLLNLGPWGSGLHYSRWLTRRKADPEITIPAALGKPLCFVKSRKKKTRPKFFKVGTKMYVMKSSLTRDAGPQGAVEWGWGWEGMGIGEVAYFPRMWFSPEILGKLLVAHFINWEPDCWEKKQFFPPLAG